MFILNAPDFYVERGHRMIKELARFFRLMPPHVFEDDKFDDYIVPFVVRYENFRKKEDCDFKFTAIEQLYD